MSVLPNAFTAAGNGPVYRGNKGKSFTYEVTGTFVADWEFVKLTPDRSAVLEVVASGDSTQSAVTVTPLEDANYRFRVADYTSGTVTAIITDLVDDIETFVNNEGAEVLTITEEGIETPKADITALEINGTEVTATAQEIINASDVSARVQELTVTGAVTAGVQSVELNHATTAIAATIADATNHQGLLIVKNTSASGTEAHTLTLTSGTLDGTNSVATLDAPGEALAVYIDSAGNGVIIENIGSVALS